MTRARAGNGSLPTRCGLYRNIDPQGLALPAWEYLLIIIIIIIIISAILSFVLLLLPLLYK